ncbi:hypothetical protein [Rahnella sp. WP5]|jgi:hypothetical protein|uniref:DUF6945 domain-containing protein n=1 Tax=Rahnella sp. WP5 TaxID=1500266 RepID=UPI00055D9218|nr:hypothetical protein [Rahnella sp. WP5]
MTERASQNKPEIWLEEDRRLFYAASVTNITTGESYDIEEKLEKVHTYMIDQYNSYREKGKQFYEDQRDIATKCRCTPKTLGKWIKVLETLGLLVIDESQKSHSYEVRSVVSQEENLVFNYPKLLNGEPSYDHDKALKRLRASKETGDNVLHIDFKKQAEIPDPQSTTWETGHKTPTIDRKSTGLTAAQIAAYKAVSAKALPDYLPF